MSDLRNEFCALLRELKQRCSLGSLGITSEVAQSMSTSLTVSPRSADSERSMSVVHSPNVGYFPNRSDHVPSDLGEVNKARGNYQESAQVDESPSVISVGGGISIGIKRAPMSLDFCSDAKRAKEPSTGGDFDEVSLGQFNISQVGFSRLSFECPCVSCKFIPKPDAAIDRLGSLVIRDRKNFSNTINFPSFSRFRWVGFN